MVGGDCDGGGHVDRRIEKMNERLMRYLLSMLSYKKRPPIDTTKLTKLARPTHDWSTAARTCICRHASCLACHECGQARLCETWQYIQVSVQSRIVLQVSWSSPHGRELTGSCMLGDIVLQLVSSHTAKLVHIYMLAETLKTHPIR